MITQLQSQKPSKCPGCPLAINIICPGQFAPSLCRQKEKYKEFIEKWPTQKQEIIPTQEIIAQIPHPFNRVNYADEADEKLKEERLVICRKCEHFDPEKVECKLCGCPLLGKVQYKHSRCPILKW